ncbi:hypothetical protein GZ212_13915 [Mangrovimonas sp. CR14]|uniref:hypothetical protein n=1 Tax=Mangrovimonas sp. CR14 TaxID=2706120 RepID=UPI0014212961|nr:hypothetical protein [Mangrovimonas sp. CR14]NIK93254.1 hypothetical protein [Mangrovimonas sp. CR14]
MGDIYKLKYTKLYADKEGETHFKEEEFIMNSKDYSPPAPPVWVAPRTRATGSTVVAFPIGWYGDFHPAPKPQWMMILKGSMEVEVSDGEKRTFLAGSIAFLDDLGSKGHISRSIGNEVSIVSVTEVE